MSKREREIGLVVFDLGGVIVRIARSWGEAHELAGFPPHPIVESEQFVAERARLAHEHQVGAIEPRDYYAAVAAISQGAYDAASVEQIIRAWTREEYPGVDEVLDALSAQGVSTAALSNTNPPHWSRLSPPNGVSTEYPTVVRIERRYASHLMGLAKPDRRSTRRSRRRRASWPARLSSSTTGRRTWPPHGSVAGRRRSSTTRRTRRRRCSITSLSTE